MCGIVGFTGKNEADTDSFGRSVKTGIQRV